MQKAHSFGLKLRYEGGDAEDHKLEFYDGTTSFQGFAQALHIATHAYINNEIQPRAPAMKGATLYVRTLKPGSLVLDILAVIEKYPATVTLAAPAFYDFLKYSFAKAVGLINVTPETNYVSKLSTADEPFFDDLAEVMEGSLQRAHRPIDQGIKKIVLCRPRDDLITFNQSTSEWVNTREEDPKIEALSGNVTRYNSITGNGRVYIHEIGKIVPFRQSINFSPLKRGYLTWSLHGNTLSGEKELSFQARLIKSARDDVKRVILEDCNQIS